MLPIDRSPQGDPETVVLLGTGEALIGLNIRGLPALTILGIREDREGQPLGCAVANQIHIDMSRQTRI